MIRLNTIGPISIDVGTTRVTATSPQACAALLYLVVERGKEVSRATLLELLFPATPDAADRHALRQLVHRLRKMGAPLDGDSATVTLAHGVATWDVELVESRASCTDEQLDLLASGYLSAFAPAMSPAFEDWLDHHRAETAARLRRTLRGQLHDEKAKQRYGAVDRIARACLALDPLDEEATLATAEVLVLNGSKTEALSVLDRYIDEVGVPLKGVRFAPKLLRERISEYVVDSGLLAEPPLVGRDGEMATLRELLGRIGRGTAEACVVWGASGIGKTRLLNEACAIAALDGIAVVRCALQPHDKRRPLAVLRDIAPRLLDLPGALGSRPDSLALMRGISGRGEMPAREMPRTSEDSEVVLAGILSAATDLMDAVCSERSLLVCIEDAHWLDPASLELVVEAVGGERPLCILLASQRAIQLPSNLAYASRLNSIEVPRLDRTTSAVLLRRLFERSGRVTDEAFVEWATALADGVAFYLQSLFIEYVTTGDRTAIPATLTASLASTLERLVEPARSVFDAVVVLGSLCTISRLEGVLQLPSHALITALRDLEERGLIRSGPTAVTFAHELFAVTARSRMPTSVAKLLHRLAAELLTRESETSTIASWDIAEHWVAAGDPTRGMNMMLACADDSMRLGGPNEAIDMLSRGIVHAAAPSERAEFLKPLLRACRNAGELQRATEVGSELIDFERRQGRQPTPELELDWFGSARESGRIGVIQIDRLMEIAADRRLDAKLRERAVMTLCLVADDTADSRLAFEAAEAIQDVPSNECLSARMLYDTVFGSMDQAIKTAKQIVLQDHLFRDDVERYAALHNVGVALWRGGEVSSAISVLQGSFCSAERLRHWGGCAGAGSQLAEVFWYADDLISANNWFAKAGVCLARTRSQDCGFFYYSIGVMLALSDGRPDEAESLLNRAADLYPSKENRHSLDLLAYRVRVSLVRAQIPEEADVSRLLSGHVEFRAVGVQDIVTDTLLWALERVGRSVEVSDLREHYLAVHRRERLKPPQVLRHLHGATAS